MINRNAIRKIAIIWQRFLPYHVARLREAGRFFQEHGIGLVAIEVATEDLSYNYPSHGININDIEHIVCFPGRNYHHITARTIHRKVYEVLVEQDADVVFAPATAFPEGMAAILYRTVHNKKSVLMDDVWECTDKKGAAVRIIKRAIHHNVDAALVPAASHVGYFTKMGFTEERIFTGLDVVDNELFATDAEQARKDALNLRETYGLPEKYFLYVGRLLPRKGLDVLIRAYEEQYAKDNGKLWPVVIIGDGPWREELEKLTASKGRYLVKGSLFGKDLRVLYGLASCFVMPSYIDPWGLVLNEAMASGLPVIASRGCGATVNLVHEGENGWSYEPSDAERLGKLLGTVAKLNDSDRVRMAERSREIMAQCSLRVFAENALRAAQVERRGPAGFIPGLLTRLWKGRVRLN